jgi:hypothetical protein
MEMFYYKFSSTGKEIDIPVYLSLITFVGITRSVHGKSSRVNTCQPFCPN